jgi:protocatechuate 3,4-dioxygenase beta subunit
MRSYATLSPEFHPVLVSKRRPVLVCTRQLVLLEPAVYPGRTRHFHFKVQAPGRSVLTTQLFFPGEPRNHVDQLFRPQLLMNISDAPRLMSAQFDFVVDA